MGGGRQYSTDFSKTNNHQSGGNFDTMMESPNALRFMSPSIGGGGGSERGSIMSKNRKRGRNGKNKEKGQAACCAPGTSGNNCSIF
jgi:hypothetical protein